MKCPKCGSEHTLDVVRPYLMFDIKIWVCQECGLEDLEEYQARLDKVLSKFKVLDKLRYNWSEHWDLVYENELFYIEIYDSCGSMLDYNVISLETVESLLKDMGEEL